MSTKLKSGSPFLYDEATDDVVGVRDSDGGETYIGLEGNWTPAIAFNTPGDSNIVLSSAVGWYQQTRNFLRLGFSITTSTFTHTTASGILKITGFPYAGLTNAARVHTGMCAHFQGITAASYTQIGLRLAGSNNYIELIASGSGQNLLQIQNTHMPTGGSVILRGFLDITL